MILIIEFNKVGFKPNFIELDDVELYYIELDYVGLYYIKPNFIELDYVELYFIGLDFIKLNDFYKNKSY